MVAARSVCVPVHHRARAGRAQRRVHRWLGDVARVVGAHRTRRAHRARGAHRPDAAALAAQLARDAQPFVQRAAQEVALPRVGARHGAGALVVDVVGAQRIAVREQHALAEQRDRARFVEQRGAGARGEPAHRPRRRVRRKGHVEQEIAVAAHRVDPRTACADRRQPVQKRLRDRVGLVVADPGLEQVAEQEQVAGAARLRIELREEQRGGARVVVAEVHVGAEQRNLVRRPSDLDHFAPPTTAIESISTASAGTSWYGPTVPVRTLRIALTTSMPLTTLPNTA